MDEKPKTKILEDGRLAFLDEHGNVTSVQKLSEHDQKRVVAKKRPRKPQKPHIDHETHTWRRDQSKGKTLLLPKGMLIEDVRELPSDFSYYNHFRATCLSIAAHISDGKTLSEIGKMNEMPSRGVILHWASKDPEFSAVLEQARKWRAETYVDNIANIADNVKEETSKSAKVKVDAWKYLAEVGDRERFGSQTKLTGVIPAVNIVFQTGIEREAIPAEGTVIEQTANDIDGVHSEGAPSATPQEAEEI